MTFSPNIRILDEHTINKIAAGEVIENPSSVVKELVENALDADAKCICIEIQEGGRQLIRISDDGIGMSQNDALLCLERYATSKIREVEDIQNLLTMGFRGEAIPSIAAISKMTLLTYPRTNEKQTNKEGTLIFIDGGHLVSCTSAPRSPGTTVEVKSLFFNVPVRRKFQKSPAFDSQEILKLIGIMSLAYPTVQFELISDQNTLLKTSSGAQSLSFIELLGKRLEFVLGKEYPKELIPLKFSEDPLEIEGYISSPTAHKPNRTGQFLFINQRYVACPLVASAITEGFGTMLPNHRYPLFVLHVRIPGSYIDVNVHPQKREIRLRQESQLKELIIHAVQLTLRSKSREIENFSEEVITPAFLKSGHSFLSSKIQQNQVEKSSEKWEFKSTASQENFPINQPNAPSNVSEITSLNRIPLATSIPPVSSIYSRPLLSEVKAKTPRVIATLTGYIVLDPFLLDSKLFRNSDNKPEGGLALLDQRAAYSRVYFEELLNRSNKEEIQHLLFPITLELTQHECEIIREHLPILNQMGLGIREFGEQVFVVDTIPSFLKQDQIQKLIEEIIEMSVSRRLQMNKEEQIALVACHTSLPSNKQLTIEEAQALVTRLCACNTPAQCPKGKPTCLYFAPEELSKWFC